MAPGARVGTPTVPATGDRPDRAWDRWRDRSASWTSARRGAHVADGGGHGELLARREPGGRLADRGGHQIDEGGLQAHGVGIGRHAVRVARPDTEAVEDRWRQPGHGQGRDVVRHIGDDREGSIGHRLLHRESALVGRPVNPGEIDLAARHGPRRQLTGRSRRAPGRRLGGRRRRGGRLAGAVEGDDAIAVGGQRGQAAHHVGGEVGGQVTADTTASPLPVAPV